MPLDRKLSRTKECRPLQLNLLRFRQLSIDVFPQNPADYAIDVVETLDEIVETKDVLRIKRFLLKNRLQPKRY